MVRNLASLFMFIILSKSRTPVITQLMMTSLTILKTWFRFGAMNSVNEFSRHLDEAMYFDYDLCLFLSFDPR